MLLQNSFKLVAGQAVDCCPCQILPRVGDRRAADHHFVRERKLWSEQKGKLLHVSAISGLMQLMRWVNKGCTGWPAVSTSLKPFLEVIWQSSHCDPATRPIRAQRRQWRWRQGDTAHRLQDEGGWSLEAGWGRWCQYSCNKGQIIEQRVWWCCAQWEKHNLKKEQVVGHSSQRLSSESIAKQSQRHFRWL